MSNIHNDIVNWNVDQFDEKANKAHNSKSNCSGHCYFLKLYDNQEEEV